jgi:hypothetical protein
MGGETSIRIWEVARDSPNGVCLENTVQRVESGDIVLLRGALQRIGLWEEIRETLWRAIDEAVGSAMTARLREIGLGLMHESMTGEQIKRCNEAAHWRLNSITGHYLPKLVREAVGYRGPGFYDQNCVIRFYVPAAFHKSNREVLETRPGYTKPQGPHMDTWFGHATSGLNLWMAIEPVRRGNGLAIFPARWRSEVPHDERFRPLREQLFGEPVTFEMDPGDMLLFHGEHLHSSELNSTRWTRVALTDRFSLRTPEIVSETTTAQWSELPSANLPQHTSPLEDMGRSYSVSEFRSVYTSPTGGGSVRALDDSWCEVTVNGVRRIVSRICTHEGGDLSRGYVENGRVYCPWHQMSFDPTTGRPACDGLAPLRVRIDPSLE